MNSLKLDSKDNSQQRISLSRVMSEIGRLGMYPNQVRREEGEGVVVFVCGSRYAHISIEDDGACLTLMEVLKDPRVGMLDRPEDIAPALKAIAAFIENSHTPKEYTYGQKGKIHYTTKPPCGTGKRWPSQQLSASSGTSSVNCVRCIAWIKRQETA